MSFGTHKDWQSKGVTKMRMRGRVMPKLSSLKNYPVFKQLTQKGEDIQFLKR